jgi:hypothetical protein
VGTAFAGTAMNRAPDFADQRQMRPRRAIPLVLAALPALAVAPAKATLEHTYARSEYAVIRDGRSPDGRKALAAHGDGESGRENFHVWLMAEPAHRRIEALDDIGSDNNLDTGADAYHAFWSKDSREVAVTFRRERHEVELNLYSIEGRRAHLIAGPSLFKEVTGRDVGEHDDVRQRVPAIRWKGPARFVLREYRLFMTADPGFAGRLGAYGKVTDRLDDGRLLVEFKAEADCVLMPHHRARVIDLKVSTFGDPGSW